MTGVPLEVSGGEGSAKLHWEGTVMGNDYMTAHTKAHMVVSAITLALFEDSGWYMPNYDMAEDLWWGKDRGCEFVQHYTCPFGDPAGN